MDRATTMRWKAGIVTGTQKHRIRSARNLNDDDLSHVCTDLACPQVWLLHLEHTPSGETHDPMEEQIVEASLPSTL